MIVTAVSNKSADKFVGRVEQSDVMLFANTGDTVNFRSELKGDTEKLLVIGKLSKTLSQTVVAGYITENYGLKKNSAIVADKGSLLGISDMSVSLGEKKYSLGCGHKVYQCSAGKIGVVIGDDIMFPETVKSLTENQADVVFAIDVCCKDDILVPLLQAYAYIYAVPMISVKEGRITFVSSNGEKYYDGKDDTVTLKIDTSKSYEEATIKKRLQKKK